MSANPFEEGQRVYVAAPALKKLLGREPAEGELYRTVRTIHPEQPERWVMLDWPFHWFEVADVTPLHDNPPRPKWGPTFYGDSNETHKYPSITEVIEEAVTSGEVEKVWASVVEHEKVVSEQALRGITFSWEDCAVVNVRREVRAREDARMWKVLGEITADKPKEET